MLVSHDRLVINAQPWMPEPYEGVRVLAAEEGPLGSFEQETLSLLAKTVAVAPLPTDEAERKRREADPWCKPIVQRWAEDPRVMELSLGGASYRGVPHVDMRFTGPPDVHQYAADSKFPDRIAIVRPVLRVAVPTGRHKRVTPTRVELYALANNGNIMPAAANGSAEEDVLYQCNNVLIGLSSVALRGSGTHCPWPDYIPD